MTKYVNSSEGLPSQLHLWSPLPTQTGILATRLIDVYPNNSIDSSDTISFTIPALERLMLDSVEVFTELRVLTKEGTDPADKANVSTAPHLGAILWRNVEVSSGGVSLTQSYDNSYAMFKFWDDAIHHGSDEGAFLKRKEGMLLDSVGDKSESENVVYFPETGTPKNVNGQSRAKRISKGQKAFLCSKLNVSIFNQATLLPTNLEFQVQLTKNYDETILLSAADDTSKIKFDRVFLRCKFQQPRDEILNLLEVKLAKRNAIYHADKMLMNIHPISTKSVTIDNLFNGPLPYFFYVGIQDRSAFGKAREKNPFSIHLIESAQLYVNGVEYFPQKLKMTDHDETNMSVALAEATGSRKDNFILHHFRVYPALGFDLTQDKTQNQHGMNLNRTGNVRIVLEQLNDVRLERVLFTLAYYDRVIEIDKDRRLFAI